MLGHAEYRTYSNELDELGQNYDEQIGDATQDISKQQAINTAKTFSVPYQQDLNKLLHRAMIDIGMNALSHYEQQIGKPLPRSLINDVIKDQYNKRYYGSTLNQRLVLTKLRLNRVMTQSAQVGPEHLSGVFSRPFPFGAQTNISKRLLQGQAIKVERDIAQKVAQTVNYTFIRWTLSRNHRVSCACEHLASRVDSEVEKYIKEKKLEIDPKGLFFRDDLPNPPHPNCQCEFHLVDSIGAEIVPSRSQRPLHRLVALIRKFIS